MKHSGSGHRNEWRRWLAVLLAAMVLVRVAVVRAGAQGEPPEAGLFIEQNVGLTVRPLSLDQLCARLGAAVKSSRNTPSLNVPGQTDRVVTVAARGIEVESYVAAGSPVVINRIVVTAGGPALPMPLRVGVSTPAAVEAALGRDHQAALAPDGRGGLRYFNFEHTASALLWFDGHNHLAGVEWSFDGD